MAYGMLIGKCVVENNPGSIFRNTRLGQEPLLPPIEKSRFTKHYQQGIQQPSRKVLVLEVSCCFFFNDFKKHRKIKRPQQLQEMQDFPGGAVDKNPPVSAWDTCSIPGPGRFHMPRSN